MDVRGEREEICGVVKRIFGIDFGWMFVMGVVFMVLWVVSWRREFE